MSPGAAAPGPVLDARALNRATLARQHLIERTTLPVAAMVEHLVGMQAQVPQDPYVALWSRLDGFRPDQLSYLIEARKAARGTLMRGTLHLATANDFLVLRALMAPVLDRVLHTQSPFGRRLAGLDVDELIGFGRARFEEQPRTRAQLVPLLAARWPDHDAASLAYALTYLLPLVQVTPRGLWRRSGASAFTTVEAWFGRSLPARADASAIVLRYLAAFGPASVADVRSWSGLAGLREVIEPLRPRLVSLRDEHGRELFDLPEAPRPDGTTPVPVRFLPEYDNVLLGHADRSRFGSDPRVPALFGERPIGLGSVLLDGELRGTWRLRQDRRSATLEIRMLSPLARADGAAIDDEAGRLLDLLADGVVDRDVRRSTF